MLMIKTPSVSLSSVNDDLSLLKESVCVLALWTRPLAPHPAVLVDTRLTHGERLASDALSTVGDILVTHVAVTSHFVNQ
jgi:hypothetical protein